MAYNEQNLSCVVGAIEKNNPRVFLYYSKDNITTERYFPAAADFRIGDKIISVNITQNANGITRIETSYVMDFIGGEWKLFPAESTIDETLENGLSVLSTTIDLGKIGTQTPVQLNQLEAFPNIDGRPSHKQPGAMVYGANGSQGIIDTVDENSATITTVVSSTAAPATGQESYGMRGDYCSTYAIISHPNGKPTISTGNVVNVPAGLVLDIPGTLADPVRTLITLASPMTHTMTKTTNCILAYVHGLDHLVECDTICFKPSQPDDDPQTTCRLWYDGKQWWFRDIDYGDTWTPCRAQPLADCIFTNGVLTRLSYIGWYTD